MSNSLSIAVGVSLITNLVSFSPSWFEIILSSMGILHARMTLRSKCPLLIGSAE